MAKELRSYGKTIDNIKMEELNEEKRDEEESYQDHGASNYRTNPLPVFLHTYTEYDSSTRYMIVLSFPMPPSSRIRLGLY
jgi:hypothetical protein